MGIAPALEGIAHRRPARQLPAVAEIADGWRRHEILVRASAIAFRMLASTVPFALFVLAMAGALSLDSLWTKDLAPNIGPKVSPAVYEILDSTVQNVLGHRQLFWLTAGFGLALWEVSAAVRAVMNAFDSIYGSRRQRSTADRLLTSAWLALVGGACVLGAAAALHLLPLVIDGFFGAVARYLLAVALLWVAVTLLVRFAPIAPQPLGWVTFGSSLVVGGWLVTWSLYGLWLTKLADVGSAYGAFAAVIVLLAFLQLSATVLLTGALLDELVREDVTGQRRAK